MRRTDGGPVNRGFMLDDSGHEIYVIRRLAPALLPQQWSRHA
jgi:hypothetical protein